MIPINFAPVEFSDSRETREDARRILQSAIDILRQGEEFLRVMPAARYRELVPLAFNASVGGHYRHCLDHFKSWLYAWDSEIVNYDHRARERQIEVDPEHALEITESFRQRLEQIEPHELNRLVLTICEVSYSTGHSPVTNSSYGRELVYVIAHAVHHYALIAVMARMIGVELPANFGLAPSTAAHQRDSCTVAKG